MKLCFFRIILFSFALFSLFASSYAQSCSTESAFNHRYKACSDLQPLESFLHWNFHEEIRTLDIAFRRRVGLEPTTWIAWAINPTGKGMVGSQALVAYRNPSGILRAYTSPVTSYGTRLEEGNLSFQVPKISTDFSNNEIIIFATIVLPKNMTTVNHLWQEGPVSGDNLGMHALSGDNVRSMGTVDLLSGKVVAAKGGTSNLLFKQVHGVINAVSWGFLMPTGAITARYMKVFADPAWFYAHIICQSSAYALGVAGAITGLYLGGKSHGIQHNSHRSIGIALLVLGFLQLLALKLRPNKEHRYRIWWNIYHHSVGYTVIILSIVNIFQGFNILNPVKMWRLVYAGILILLGAIAVTLEAVTWIIVVRRKKETSQITVTAP